MYERMACTKKRGIDNRERMPMAQSLFKMKIAHAFVSHTLVPTLLHVHLCTARVILKIWSVDTALCKLKTNN